MIRKNNQGFSSVLGVILLIGLLISIMSIYMGVIVPNNAAIKESNTHDKVYSQMYEVSETVYDTSSKDRSDTVVIDTSTDYTFGDIFPTVIPMDYTVNNTQELQVNIEGYNDSSRTFLDSKSGSSVQYESDRISLIPIYSENNYNSVGIEHNIVYYNLVESQNMVNDNTIILPIINANPDSYTTNSQSLNAKIDSDEYTVTNVDVNNNDDFEITLETKLSENSWDSSVFESEINNGHINEVRYEEKAGSTNDVVIDFESNEEYTIKMTNTDIIFS